MCLCTEVILPSVIGLLVPEIHPTMEIKAPRRIHGKTFLIRKKNQVKGASEAKASLWKKHATLRL